MPLGAQEDEAAGRLLMTAQQQMRDGDLESALQELSELLSRFPESAAARRALMDSASIHFLSGQFDRADRLAEQVIESHGSSVESAEAEVLRARVQLRSARSFDDVAEARTRLSRIPTLYGSDRFPDLPARAQALLLGAQASADLGDPGSALAGFLETLEDEPPGPWSAPARLGMAYQLLEAKSWQAAAELLQEVADAPASGPRDGKTLGDLPPSVEARTLLTLLHRFWLRPTTTEPRWRAARRVPTPSLKKPRGVAAAVDGSVAIADPGTSSLLVISAQAGETQNTGLPRNPTRPWFAPRTGGFLAFADGIQPLEGGGKQSFTLGGEKPKALSKIEAGASGIFDETLLIDRDVEGVAVFDRDGRAVGLLGGRDSVDIASDRGGRLYVLSTKPGKVSVFGADRKLVHAFTSAATRPVAIDVDLLGNIYVLDDSRAAIEVTDRVGTSIKTLGPLLPGGIELKGPEDIAVDGDGRIYIADAKLGAVVVVE